MGAASKVHAFAPAAGVVQIAIRVVADGAVAIVIRAWTDTAVLIALPARIMLCASTLRHAVTSAVVAQTVITAVETVTGVTITRVRSTGRSVVATQVVETHTLQCP